MLRNFYLQMVGGTTVAHGVQHLGNGKVVVFWATDSEPNSVHIYDSMKAMRGSLGVFDGSFVQVIWSGGSDHPAGRAVA